MRVPAKKCCYFSAALNAYTYFENIVYLLIKNKNVYTEMFKMKKFLNRVTTKNKLKNLKNPVDKEC